MGFHLAFKGLKIVVIGGNTYITFYTVKVNVVKFSFIKVPWYLIHPFGRPCFLFASYSVVLEKLF